MTPPIAPVRVSSRGQLNLPAALRHRWGVADGGELAVIDLGDVALVLPNGIEAARAEVRRVLMAGAYEAGLLMIGDPELADQ